MRYAGDLAQYSDNPVIGGTMDAIRRNSKSADPGLQASVHIGLDTNERGYINDGDPTEYVYRGGTKATKQGEEFANPLSGQGAGARQLEQLPRQDSDAYNRIMEEIDILNQGTGRYAQSNTVPFA